MDVDVMMKRIEDVMAAQYRGGDRDAARRQFSELWDELGPAGDPLCRCTLAHHMADLQDDVEEALRCDLQALETADLLTDARVQSQHPSLSVSALYPSLLLNVAEDYRKLADVAKAREYLSRAQDAMAVLPTTEYGAMIRGGIARLAERLESAAPGP